MRSSNDVTAALSGLRRARKISARLYPLNDLQPVQAFGATLKSLDQEAAAITARLEVLDPTKDNTVIDIYLSELTTLSLLAPQALSTYAADLFATHPSPDLAVLSDLTTYTDVYKDFARTL